MRIAIDTNILVYAAGADDVERQQKASDFLAAIADHQRFVPVQVLGEFYRVLRRKFRQTSGQANSMLARQRLGVTLIETSESALEGALELCQLHQFDIWDAINLSAAAQADCHVLLTEDGQSGFRWRGVTIVDPFAGELHPLAVQLLNGK